MYEGFRVEPSLKSNYSTVSLYCMPLCLERMRNVKVDLFASFSADALKLFEHIALVR